jgi:chromosomal replication initiator protein
MKATWARTKKVLAERLDKREIANWIEPLVFHDNDSKKLTLKAPNQFVMDWFNVHYSGMVKDIFFELTSRNLQINVDVDTVGKCEQLNFGDEFLGAPIENGNNGKSKPKTSRLRFVAKGKSLNLQYSFGRFVVGAANRFAHAACMAVAKKPGRVYNPLFLYGASGLGKSHLLHAIGHYIFSSDPAANVSAMTAERFTNEMITALRQGHIDAFRRKFRRSRVLLIDDVEFLQGKERTQVEFFHAFNEIHESGAQIVVTSDHAPKDLTELDARLRSRFSWGLIADLQPPDLETRVAILQRKAMDADIQLPADLAFYLADHFQANIRELEGALVRVSAFASLHRMEMSIGLAEQILQNIMEEKDEIIDVAKIQHVVCDYFQIKLKEMTGARRQKNFALPRQIAGYMARELTDASFPEIGRQFGGRDHSTIMHACKKIRELRTTDKRLNKTITELERRVRGC